jgi:hypothetical protein
MTTGIHSTSTDNHIKSIVLIMYTATQATVMNGMNEKLTITSALAKTHKDCTVVWAAARGVGKRTSG